MAAPPISDKKDIKIGLVSAVLGLVLILLLLLFLSFEVAYPKPIPPKVEAFTELEELDLENLKVDAGGGSEGSASKDPVTDPKPETEEIITNNKSTTSKTNTGKGKKTDAANSQNDPSNAKQNDNPFGGKGTGDDGKGSGAFGKDEGSGSGAGPGGLGDGTGRQRLTDPDVDDIISDVNHVIYLRVIINSEGRVLSANNLSAKTTTTDARIINKVRSAVISDVRFSKKPGSGQEQVVITININAN